MAVGLSAAPGEFVAAAARATGEWGSPVLTLMRPTATLDLIDLAPGRASSQMTTETCGTVRLCQAAYDAP